MSESDESFLVSPNHVDPNKVWVEIDDAGELRFVDWDIVGMLNEQFNTLPPDKRTEQMLIAKLMWLVRKQTREEYNDGNN